MRAMSIVKVVALAAAVALPSAAFAKGKAAPPPGSCAFGKSYIATNTFCSFNCNATTQWCSQQLCVNGVVTPVLPCYGTFCSAKCGG
jgi:hypothetical protein